MPAPRLTEDDVHTACAQLIAQGERPTSITLLEKLGRGSLTTITKYLHSWQASDEAKAIQAESLPISLQLPEELSKNTEELLKKIWHIAKKLADEELETHRNALKTAANHNQKQIEEAFQFSEAQTQKIEVLEEHISALEHSLTELKQTHTETTEQLDQLDKQNFILGKDNEQLKHEIQRLNQQLEQQIQATQSADNAKIALQTETKTQLQQQETEIKNLTLQIHKLQITLESAEQENEECRIQSKQNSTQLDDKIHALEKLSLRHESATEELKQLKKELQQATQSSIELGKLTAKLEGQLQVYQALEHNH